MSLTPASPLPEPLSLYRCPRCGNELEPAQARLVCRACTEAFPIRDGIPMLFWPDEADESQDLTRVVKDFYEETPFPDYDDFDSIASFRQKASAGLFARALDQQVPAAARILECGCGTGQLSNFLSIAGRTVFATDMCVNSLRLGQRFAHEHQLEAVHFTQMNLLRPCFAPESFHLVISNGVLMTTRDPFATFQQIARLVKPGGYILIGLYHRYGRLLTDARRILFRLTGNRFTWVDPLLRDPEVSAAKKRAWFADQYQHPHEVKHTIGDALRWFGNTGFEFVRSIPRSRPFQPTPATEGLFEPEPPGNRLERLVVELGMVRDPSHDGGFFVAIGRKPARS